MTIPTARQTPLLALLVARAISESGTMLSGVALPLFVLSLTNNVAQLGLITALQTVPLFVMGLIGGPAVDRLGARRVSVLTDLVALLAFGAVPLLAALSSLPLGMLALLVFVGSCAEALGLTARLSLVPALAQEAGWPLERANAAVGAIGRFAIVLGPLSAGLLVGLLSPATVLLIDAASFGVSALLIARGVGRQPRQQRAGNYRAQLQEGLCFLRQDRTLLALMAIFSGVNAVLNPVFMVILPAYTEAVLRSPAALGLLIASFGGGTLGGALLYGAVGTRLPRSIVLVGCFALILLSFAPLILGAPLPILAAALALMGLGVGPCGPLVMTVLAERTPAELHGRVFGIYSAGANGGIPLGVLITGQLLNAFSFQAVLLLFALIFVLLLLAMLALKRTF